jgi:hypothetical protein
LNGPGNRVGSWKGSNTGTGAIEWTNLGVINIQGIANSGGSIVVKNTGGITTSGAVSASVGSVSMTANSPLTIGSGGVSASGNIVLSATNLTSSGDMNLNGTISSSAGAVTLNAAHDLAQNATVFGALGVTANVGGTLTLTPNARTGAAPVSYMVGGVPVAPPPGITSPTSPTSPATPIPVTPSTPNPSGVIASAVEQQTNLLTTFLDKFEIALQTQNDGKPDRDKYRNELLVEGEICRP